MPSCLDERAPGVPTSELVEREELLEGTGHRYHLIRCCYVNRSQRRVFSIEFLERHTKEELQRLIDAPATADWLFHFNEPPGDSVRRILIEDFEKWRSAQ